MLNDILKAIVAIVLAIVAAEMETPESGKGTEKKVRAQALIVQALDPLLPDWMNPVVQSCGGFLIDALVTLLNRTGFFARFTAAFAA